MKKLNYDLELSKELYAHYIDNEIGYNEICKRCKSYSESKGRILKNGPIPIFHIGDMYKESKVRLLFLGTVAYGWEGLHNMFVENKDIRTKNLEETIYAIEDWVLHLFQEQEMRFFSFIKESVEKNELFGSDALRMIAVSNLIKCNMGSDKIRNSHLQKNYDFCIKEEYTGNLLSDVKVLDPTHIIILSKNTTKFWRYGKIFIDQGRKVTFVHHPSSSTIGGKEKFISDVNDFIKNDK